MTEMVEEATPGFQVPYLETEPKLERFFIADANDGMFGCRYCEEFNGPWETVQKGIIEHIKEKHGHHHYNVGLLERSVEIIRRKGQTDILKDIITARAADPSTVESIIKLIMVQEGLW